MSTRELPISSKEKIKDAADAAGESVTRYIQKSIEARLGEEL